MYFSIDELVKLDDDEEYWSNDLKFTNFEPGIYNLYILNIKFIQHTHSELQTRIF